MEDWAPRLRGVAGSLFGQCGGEKGTAGQRGVAAEQQVCGEQKGWQNSRAEGRRTTPDLVWARNNGLPAASGVPVWAQGRRYICCYIFSGALKPRMLMHMSKTFSVRVISATSDRRVVLSSSAKIFLSW